MPSKKRKEAQKKYRANNRLAEETRIATAITHTGEISEPGEKVMKLQEILEDINNIIHIEKVEINVMAGNAEANVMASGVISGAALVVGAIPAVLVAPPVGLGMFIAGVPAMFGGIPFGLKRGKTAKKKFAAEAQDHLQKMEDLKQSVISMRNAVAKNHKEEIVHSRFYEQVSNLPDLAKEFEGVAAQQINKYKEQARAAREAAEYGVKPEDNKPGRRTKPIASPLNRPRRTP